MNAPNFTDEATQGVKINMWIDATKQLPNDGEWVLAHLTVNNWGPNRDVYFKVVRFDAGIGLEQRKQMKANGDRRANIIRGSDEWGNNKLPYQWVEHGPGTYYGQDVDYWMRIPQTPKLIE